MLARPDFARCDRKVEEVAAAMIFLEERNDGVGALEDPNVVASGDEDFGVSGFGNEKDLPVSTAAFFGCAALESDPFPRLFFELGMNRIGNNQAPSLNLD